MLVGELRVLLDDACRHGQVAANGLGVLLGQGLQLVPRNAVEVVGRDVVGKLGVIVTGTHRTQLTLHALLFGHLLFDDAGIAVVTGRSAVAGPQLLAGVDARGTGTVR